MISISQAITQVDLQGGWWGFKRLRPDPVPACEKCGEPVVIVAPEHERGRFAVCKWCGQCLSKIDAEYERQDEAAWIQENADRLIRASGVPAGFRDLLVNQDRLNDTDALLAATEFAGSKKRLLVLGGGFGLGKSLAAAWLIWELGGRFVTSARIIAKSLFNDEVWEPLLRTKTLVIDDFGSQHGEEKPGATDKLDALIVERFDGGRRTVLTTNMTTAEVKKRLTARAWDRLATNGTIVELSGKSLRGDEAARAAADKKAGELPLGGA